MGAPFLREVPLMAVDKPAPEELFRRLFQAGGKAYFTGGAVRDQLLLRRVRDTDVVVFGMGPETLLEVLSGFGQVSAYGKSFRVYHVRGFNTEFSLPRDGCDQVVAGEEQGMALDALGRDFTINALYKDPLTGAIKDPLNGLEDLAQKQLRHTSPESFVQDPLRVLRAVQLSCRLGFRLAPCTREAMGKVSLKKVAPERIYEELSKWLMTPAPGRGWELLSGTGHAPDLCFQSAGTANARSLPDGWDQVMTDTLNLGAGLRGASLQPRLYMWGLLLFTCALAEKREETQWPDNQWQEKTIRAFRQLSHHRQHAESLSALLRGLVHFQDYSHRGPDAARLSMVCNLEELDLAVEGLLPCWQHAGLLKPVLEAANRLKKRGPREKISPQVTGGDLKQWGYQEGKNMGLLLDIAFQMQLEGVARATIEHYFKKQRVLLEKAGRLG